MKSRFKKTRVLVSLFLSGLLTILLLLSGETGLRYALAAGSGTYQSENGKFFITLTANTGSGVYWNGYDFTLKNNSEFSVISWQVVLTVPATVTGVTDTWGNCTSSLSTDTSGNKIITLKSKSKVNISSGGSVSGMGFGYNHSQADPATQEVLSAVVTYDVSSELPIVPVADEDNCKYDITTAVAENSKTPFQMHGALSLSGTDIVDKDGNPFRLRGVSTHGLQHTGTVAYKDYVNEEALTQLRDNWGVNLLRLAVYTEEGGYCSGGSASMDETIQKGVSLAAKLGMYVIIDWHILSDGNPQTHKAEAKQFFEKYASMYQDNDHVIYEICNEPNGSSWSNDVKPYAEEIIPIIRKYDSDALICVGTPTWSQDVDVAANNPVSAANAKNVLYSIHFYAASHYDNIKNKVKTAHEKGLPIFCTEFGVCDASGNGSLDLDNADDWMSLFKEYNISSACWSFSNKDEAASIFKSSCTRLNNFTNDSLSDAGAWLVNTYRPLAEEEQKNYANTSEDSEIIRGDANLDGIVNVLDMEAIQRHILGLAELSEKGQKAAKVSGEDTLSVLDMEKIQRFILGLITIEEL